jgi:hypothetical protein
MPPGGGISALVLFSVPSGSIAHLPHPVKRFFYEIPLLPIFQELSLLHPKSDKPNPCKKSEFWKIFPQKYCPTAGLLTYETEKTGALVRFDR